MSGKRLLEAQGSVQASWFPECSVCLSKARTIRFDCGHLVCCDTCAAQLTETQGGCPICRSAIGTVVFNEIPPVPGRQPTFESVDVALNRLVKALRDDASPEAQQEAAFALCIRAQEEGRGFEGIIERGVLPPLVALLRDGTDAAKACCAVTLGLIAPVASEELTEAGVVVALLGALEHPPVAEYAALALSNLAECAGDSTAAAILSTPHGYAPLVALVMNEDTDDTVCEAACGALTNLTDPNAEHGAVAACVPLVGRLRALKAKRDGGGENDLAQAATALLANIEAILAKTLTAGGSVELPEMASDGGEVETRAGRAGALQVHDPAASTTAATREGGGRPRKKGCAIC